MNRKHKAAPSASEKFSYLNAAIADPDLSAAAKVVLVSLVLRFRNSKTGRCNPSMATIGKAVGRDRRNVVPVVKELGAKGWLKIATTKGGSKLNTNKYSFDFKQRGPVMKSSPVMKTVPTSDVNAPRILEEPPSPLGEGGVCVISPALARAPNGARCAKSCDSMVLAEDFESLCLIWRRPHGIDRDKALKAFRLVCSEHPARHVLASAERWMAATEPRFVKKLEDWLDHGAWRNEPPVRGAERTGRKQKVNPAHAMLIAGGFSEHGE